MTPALNLRLAFGLMAIIIEPLELGLLNLVCGWAINVTTDSV
jgi:hypothetical protein